MAWSMQRHDIAVLVGSLRRDSINRKLADAIIRFADFTSNLVAR